MNTSPVYTHILSEKPDFPLSEVLRYMGAAQSEDAQIKRMAQNAKQTICELANCRASYMFTTAKTLADDMVDMQVCSVRSKAFSEYIHDCDGVCIFAATIGIAVDREILRTGHFAPSMALALQAAGAAAIESYCDLLCNEVILGHIQTSDLHLKSRYSAGYGDLSVEYQKQILTALDAQKKIGVMLTDGCMLTPTKSVTAFVGISKHDSCTVDKCKKCNKFNCSFRKECDE